MILDNYISRKNKIILSILVGSIWIYFRTFDCYSLLPRKKISSIVIVSIWIYLNYIDPFFLPIGILIMILYKYL